MEKIFIFMLKKDRFNFKYFGIFTIQSVPEYREQTWKLGREHRFLIVEDYEI